MEEEAEKLRQLTHEVDLQMSASIPTSPTGSGIGNMVIQTVTPALMDIALYFTISNSQLQHRICQ